LSESSVSERTPILNLKLQRKQSPKACPIEEIQATSMSENWSVFFGRRRIGCRQEHHWRSNTYQKISVEPYYYLLGLFMICSLWLKKVVSPLIFAGEETGEFIWPQKKIAENGTADREIVDPKRVSAPRCFFAMRAGGADKGEDWLGSMGGAGGSAGSRGWAWAFGHSCSGFTRFIFGGKERRDERAGSAGFDRFGQAHGGQGTAHVSDPRPTFLGCIASGSAYRGCPRADDRPPPAGKSRNLRRGKPTAVRPPAPWRSLGSATLSVGGPPRPLELSPKAKLKPRFTSGFATF